MTKAHIRMIQEISGKPEDNNTTQPQQAKSG